jgi:hypothetical protein
MSSPRVVGSARAHRRWVSCPLIAAALGACLVACRSRSAPERAAPSSEPERFSFALPSSYEKLELRGEGSETLRAPLGARVTRSDKGFNIEAADDFALTVVSNAPALQELAPASVARVFSEADLAVFKSEQGRYSFVVVRELVPEWDDSMRQRFACGSAGGAVSGSATAAAVRGFAKGATEQMVAACRSLELPKLE